MVILTLLTSIEKLLVQIPLESTVFSVVVSNHEGFSSCFSEDDSEIELKHCKSGGPEVRVQIPLESTVFLLTLAVLENHEIFSTCFSVK